MISGQSGTGKTTLARIMQSVAGRAIFNDEFNILLPHDGTFFAYSTPFTTPEKFVNCTYGSAPVKKIVFLKKALKTRIEPLPLPHNYFSLMSGIYSFPTSEKLSTIIMENAEKAARAIRCEKLFINHSDNDPDNLINLLSE
jgi:hypothetical protein